MLPNKMLVILSLAICLIATSMVGCGKVLHPGMSGWATSDIDPTHAKPYGVGYYKNWDPYAGQLVIDRVEDTGPVLNDEVFIATVLDKKGKPLENRRVEWILAEGSIGDIVEVDESGIRDSRGYKINNKYAISHSGNYDHVFDRGTDDPSDDIVIGKGQTWCVLNSPLEGDSHLMAYVPAIYNWEEQKKLALYHWRDFEFQTAGSGMNCQDSPATLSTMVTRASNGDPLPGYEVTYQLIDGVDAVFEESNARSATVLTDSQGMAHASLRQTAGTTGTNTVQVDIVRPGNAPCCIDPLHLATATMEQSWMAPDIALSKSMPDSICGKEATIQLTVSNNSSCTASDVIVNDRLPAGLSLISSSPQASRTGDSLSWSLGSLAASSSRNIELRVQSDRSGQFSSEAVAGTGSKRDMARASDSMQVRCPALFLSYEAPREVTACDPVPHTVIVRNEGDGPAENVIVEVDIAEGLRPASGSNRQRFNVGTLAAGASKTISLMTDPQRTGNFTTQAMASADGGLHSDASGSTLVNQPNLELARTGPKQRYIGREATYEIVVRNTGDTVARNVMVTETVPTGMEFVRSTQGGLFSQGKITWDLEALPPGAIRTVSHTLRAVRPGTAESQTMATAFCADASLRDATQIEGIAALLLEVIDVDDPVEIGNEVIYVIKVTNQGTSNASAINVSAILPSQMSFLDADGPTAATARGQEISFGQIISLAPKQQAIYRLRAKANVAGDVRFNAKMTIEGLELPVQESESTFLY